MIDLIPRQNILDILKLTRPYDTELLDIFTNTPAVHDGLDDKELCDIACEFLDIAHACQVKEYQNETN